MKRKWAFTVGSFGFIVALSVYLFTSYLSSNHRLYENPRLLVAICPPSVIAIAFDDRHRVANLVGWIVIAVVNAGLYAMVGTAFGWTAHRWSRRSD